VAIVGKVMLVRQLLHPRQLK